MSVRETTVTNAQLESVTMNAELASAGGSGVDGGIAGVEVPEFRAFCWRFFMRDMVVGLEGAKAVSGEQKQEQRRVGVVGARERAVEWPRL